MESKTHYFRTGIALTLVILCAASASADQLDDQYVVAANHYRYGRWQQAADAFAEFLAEPADPQQRSNPRYEGVRFFLGESLVQLGRHEEARQHFAQLLENQPDNRYARQAQFRLGESAYLTGRSDEARQLLDDFLRDHSEHPLNAFGLCYLGDLALAGDDPEAARRYYSQSLADYPESTMNDACRFGLARSLEELGNVDEALRFYRSLSQPPTDATGKTPPRSELADDAQLQLAMLLHHAGRWDEALAEWQAFRDLYPKSEWLPHAGYWRAMTLARLKRLQDAGDEFKRLAESYPDHELTPAMHFQAAEQFRSLGDAPQSQSHYETVYTQWATSEWADDSMQANLESAREAGDLARVRSLAKLFEQQHRDSPLRLEVLQSTGHALLQAGENEEAAARFQQLTESFENVPADAQRRRRAHYFLALAYLQAERFDDALTVLDLIPSDPTEPPALQKMAAGIRSARAAALMGAKRYDEVVPVLDSMLEKELPPADAAQAHAQKTVALTHLGQWERASSAAEALLASSPLPDFVPPTILFMAESTYTGEAYSTAQKWFEWIASLPEAEPDLEVSEDIAQRAIAGLAWTQLKLNGPDAATAEAFQRLLTEYPESPLAAEAAFMRAKTLEKQGDVEAALTTYQTIAEQDGASQYLRLALAQAARIHDELQQDPQALQLLERLLTEFPDHPQEPNYLYQKAWVLVDLERAEEADQVFRDLAQRFPESPYWADATYRLAERAARAHQWDEANRLTQQLVQSEPSDEILTYALYLQGQLAASQKNWGQVEPPLQRLVTESPRSSLRLPAEFWIAESLYRLGRFREAGARFDGLAEVTEGRTEPWWAMIALRRAQMLAQKKQWSEAYALAEPIRARYPNFRQQYEVDYLLGRCQASAAKFDEARKAYERVVQSPVGGRTETAARAQWMIGESYLHQKNYREALSAYHRVESLFDYPHWQAAALLQAGKCYEFADRWEDAVALYQQLLQRFAETEFAEPARQRLAEARTKTSVATSPSAPSR